jgi:hypothetical protein
MTAKIDATSATATVAANQGTYVGTMYATANGQTSMVSRPAAASGGNNNFLGLYNAYNRIRIYSRSMDTTSTWTYNTSAWRQADNSASNRVSFVDGLQQSMIEALYETSVTADGTHTAGVGTNLDATTGAPNFTCIGSSSTIFTMSARDFYYPQLGFHYVQAMENGGGNSAAVWQGGSNAGLYINLDM